MIRTAAVAFDASSARTRSDAAASPRARSCCQTSATFGVGSGARGARWSVRRAAFAPVAARPGQRAGSQSGARCRPLESAPACAANRDGRRAARRDPPDAGRLSAHRRLLACGVRGILPGPLPIAASCLVIVRDALISPSRPRGRIVVAVRLRAGVIGRQCVAGHCRDAGDGCGSLDRSATKPSKAAASERHAVGRLTIARPPSTAQRGVGASTALRGRRPRASRAESRSWPATAQDSSRAVPGVSARMSASRPSVSRARAGAPRSSRTPQASISVQRKSDVER